MAEKHSAQRARQTREEDDLRVHAVFRLASTEWWRFKGVCAALSDVPEDRVRAALVRLSVRGELVQQQDGQANHYHWRLAEPHKGA